jgi:glutamate-1-semialdehyde aminotransferase
MKAAESLIGWFNNMSWIGKNEGAEAEMQKLRYARAVGTNQRTSF